MDQAAPSMFKATLIGGATAGVVASIPLVSALNCLCCSLVISGGFFAAFLYSRECGRAGAAFRPGSGAMVGLVAGLFYSVVSTIGAAVVHMVSPAGTEEAIDQVLEQLEGQPNVPPETIEMIEGFMRLITTWAGLFIVFCITLLVAAIFSTVGGLIGGAVFKVEPRQDRGAYVGPIGS